MRFPKGTTIEQRFFAKVNKTDGCWEWTGALGGSGYGRFSGDGTRWWAAHRWSYERLVGPIPPGLVVCHKCDNKVCVNPAHLFVGTHKDNIQDCIAKGRFRGVVDRWPTLDRVYCLHGHLRSENMRAKKGTKWSYCLACNREGSKRWRDQQKHKGSSKRQDERQKA